MKKLLAIFKDMDKPLLFFTIFMIGYGLLNIVTASSRQAVSQDVPMYYYFYKQSQMILVASVISLFILFVDTKQYKKFVWLLYLIIGVILVLLLIQGSSHRGSINWIDFGGIRFQPSEFAKPILIVFLSLLMERFYVKLRTKGINHWPYILLLLAVGLFLPAVVILQKDLGTGMILFGIFAMLFLASPILRKEKAKIILFASCAVLIVLVGLKVTDHHILSEEQRSRFDFFNPCSKYEDGGYQICNGFIAINDGGLFGLGIGKSKQKYSYIPEPHTDSVFSIIVEEYGLFFSLFLILVFMILLYRILKIAALSTTLRGRYIALGVATYMFLHIFFNLGGLFGVLPLTGVPLPFLSYGGSFTISLICSISIVQRIHIERKRKEKN